MRRAAIVLAACFGAVTGCRGSVAQEPSNGAVAAGPAAAARATLSEDAIPIASEVEVRRAIALVSDGRRPRVKRPRHVTVVQREALPSMRVVQEADSVTDVQLVVDHGSNSQKGPVHEHETVATARRPAVDGKPAEAKTCNGLVHRRS